VSRRGRRVGAGLVGRAGASSGQATVELALALPLVMVLLLLVVQVGTVVHDQVLVIHAAREAARAASVLPVGDRAGPQAAAGAAGPLDRSRLRTEVTDGGGPPGSVSVHVSYRCLTDLPLIGALVPDLTLEATAVMGRE
jgi:Flp pilus assembly protein TadG